MTTATKPGSTKAVAPAVASPVPATAVSDRKPRTSLPPVDFSDVSATDGGEVRQDRKSALDGTPVRGWVKDSRDNGNKVKTIQIKTAGIDTLKSLIQRAAQEAGHGVKFGAAVALKDKPGYSGLSFATKDRAQIDMTPEAVAARSATRKANKEAKAKAAGK